MQFGQIVRREFIGCSAARPRGRSRRGRSNRHAGGRFSPHRVAAGSEHLVAAFRQGLKEVGFVEGQNVAIEYRWAEGHYDRLPGMAADLVRRAGSRDRCHRPCGASRQSGDCDDSDRFRHRRGSGQNRLVASLNRPGENVTGVASLGKVLVAKRFELLRELLPGADAIAFLVNPNNAVAELDTSDAQAAAAALGQKLIVVKAGNEADIDAAFAAIARQRGGGLLQQLDPFLQSRREQLVALAARDRLPAIYERRDFVAAGGLASYGTSLTDALHLVGSYAGRILKGEKPADLPVQQPVKFELVINLKTAKALGLEVPPTLLVRADEVIE